MSLVIVSDSAVSFLCCYDIFVLLLDEYMYKEGMKTMRIRPIYSPIYTHIYNIIYKYLL